MGTSFKKEVENRFEKFESRHLGSTQKEVESMLDQLGVSSIQELIEQTIPASICSKEPLRLKKTTSESEAISELKAMLSKNQKGRSFLGMGYVNTITPPVILRNIIENPGWYTQYTPYQAEIAQGRLEALLNFQTMVIDFTGLEIANASLLDEATAAAEAMAMAYVANGKPKGKKKFFISQSCYLQTIEVVKTRARSLDIELKIASPEEISFSEGFFGALLQYPTSEGEVTLQPSWSSWIKRAQENEVVVVMAADLMGLALLKSPGALGADIAIGSTQCFGVPLGFGGPHAAYLSAKETFKRLMPGRIVGLSKDQMGNPAIRLALQTREQHIRRDRATSNICTAQVLLAIVASMYAVYHGPTGIKKIAERVYFLTRLLFASLKEMGFRPNSSFFNTLTLSLDESQASQVMEEAKLRKVNLRGMGTKRIGITLDETTQYTDLEQLVEVFSRAKGISFDLQKNEKGIHKQLEKESGIPEELKRKESYLTHPVFNSYHSETEMLRYITRLQSRDLSLAQSMIPLGSCTMKLNATSEMFPITWPEVSSLHPFVPEEQSMGYREMIGELEEMLSEITGFSGVSLQPNAGSQGEYAGLLVIKKYHEDRGEGHRKVCLIPQSAHGTNPASAAMAGMKIIVVRCDSDGNIDLNDLKEKAIQYRSELSALMVTYPSTHGVFEEAIREICEVIHKNGGQVYLDGANMNAQVGYCRPGEYGADVCHLNLHKTFSIPHGGGGPGVGPIAVAKHLIPYLPDHPVVRCGGEKSVGAVAAAPWGSAGILPISYLYIRMMGGEGLARATERAILHANYIANRLSPYFPVLYRGKRGRVAHECIVDLRPAKEKTGVEVEDVAKRLMDYGFHAPTISFPVPGTMMIEPTESESKEEIDRFCEALILIHQEIKEIEQGRFDSKNNLLKNAPHTAEMIAKAEWDFPYSRERAAFPAPWVKKNKFWPYVARIDNVYGERNLICSCPPVMESRADSL